MCAEVRYMVSVEQAIQDNKQNKKIELQIPQITKFSEYKQN
jgi:hypothetical protein